MGAYAISWTKLCKIQRAFIYAILSSVVNKNWFFYCLFNLGLLLFRICCKIHKCMQVNSFQRSLVFKEALFKVKYLFENNHPLTISPQTYQKSKIHYSLFLFKWIARYIVNKQKKCPVVYYVNCKVYWVK